MCVKLLRPTQRRMTYMLLEAIASILLIGTAYKLDKRSERKFKTLEEENKKLLSKTGASESDQLTNTTASTTLDESATKLTEKQVELMTKLFDVHNILDDVTNAPENAGKSLRTLLFLPFDTIMRKYYKELTPFIHPRSGLSSNRELLNTLDSIQRLVGKAPVETYSKSAVYYASLTENKLQKHINTLHELIQPTSTIFDHQESIVLLTAVFEQMDEILSNGEQTLVEYQQEKLADLLTPTTHVPSYAETVLSDNASPQKETLPQNPFDKLDKLLTKEGTGTTSTKLPDTESTAVMQPKDEIMRIPIQTIDESLQSSPTDIPPPTLTTEADTSINPTTKKEDTTD